MKLTIDTKHDSPEEIRRAIHLLKTLIEGKEVHTNDASLFDLPTNTSSSEPAPDMQGMMSLFDNPEPEEKKEEISEKPQLEFF